jgi:hypothetical protein
MHKISTISFTPKTNRFYFNYYVGDVLVAGTDCVKDL